MRKFDYIRPSTIEEAGEILAQHGDKANILNGGTDLIVRIRDGYVKPDYVVDIKNIPGMRHIGYLEGRGFFIGGSVTMNELLMNGDILRDYRLLAESAHEVGSYQLRNRATLAGNVCNASPSGDTLPALYILEAKVMVYSRDGESLIPIQDFILGVRETALNPGEIVTGILLPHVDGVCCGAYYKHSRRRDVDLATVSAAVLYIRNSWRVCFGAVGATPLRGRRTEEMLNNLRHTEEDRLQPVLDAAASEVLPIDDVRASAEYRTDMTKVALKRALMRVSDILKNGYPEN